MRDLLERLELIEAESTEDGLVLGAGEVFVRSASHNASGQIQKIIGREPQGYYNFRGPKGTAGTSYIVLTTKELAKVKKERGRWVSSVKAYKPRGGLKGWHPTIRFM